MERATGRRPKRVGWLPLEAGLVVVEVGHSRQQSFGVRVEWRFGQLAAPAPASTTPPEVHDGDPVGHQPGGGQVVGDEQDSHAELPP